MSLAWPIPPQGTSEAHVRVSLNREHSLMAEQSTEPAKATVTERVVTREIRPDPPLGPNATSTDVPDDHFFLATDGKTKINAFGEEIGSAADKKRKASA